MLAAHAMQSGVAAKMGYDKSETDPKHLRVGINSAMRDQASLVRLLIDKGVIEETEYEKAIADGMEEEVRGYEKELSDHYKRPVSLH